MIYITCVIVDHGLLLYAFTFLGLEFDGELIHFSNDSTSLILINFCNRIYREKRRRKEEFAEKGTKLPLPSAEKREKPTVCMSDMNMARSVLELLE